MRLRDRIRRGAVLYGIDESQLAKSVRRTEKEESIRERAKVERESVIGVYTGLSSE